jgi:hypothetical protein
MITKMPAPCIGSIWSVLGLRDATVVVLAGPFRTTRENPEHLVAPLYTGAEPGFVWTSEDVRLDTVDTGLETTRYAAIWNARPVLETDLALELGELSEGAKVAVRDAYWASLNERPLGPDPRLGRPIRSHKEPAARFQAHEMERWEALSGRVFEPPLQVSANVLIPWSDSAVFGGAELGVAIQESEALIGPAGLSSSGFCMVSVNNARFAIGLPTVAGESLPDLFTVATDSTPYAERGISVHLSPQQQAESAAAANSELALAA